MGYINISLLGRGFRFIALIIMGSIFHHKWILEWINSYYDLHFILNYIDKETLVIWYTFLILISMIFWFLHLMLHAIIRIIFFKFIVRNSSILLTIIKCIITAFKVCVFVGAAIGVGLGVPGIDYCFQEVGHVPSLRGFCLKRSIIIFGANDAL